jgi:molybdate transport system regulatory protein
MTIPGYDRASRWRVAKATVGLRAWIEVGGKPLLGPGRARLLEEIEARGSISAAARSVGVTYRTAWRWIEHMNAAAGRDLVKGTRGGREGGGARLTAFGLAALRAARRVEELAERFREEAGRDVVALLGSRRRGRDAGATDD